MLRIIAHHLPPSSPSQVDLEALPERRIAIFNHKRNSKIYMKELVSGRALDAEELFWITSLGSGDKEK